MSSSRRPAKFWISAWLPVVIGVAVIALESTPAFGADRTSSPLRWLYQAIFGPVSDAQWDPIHFFIRKSGHFVGYGTLGLLWLRAWWLTLAALRASSFWRSALLGWAGAALVASCDEWHQTFLPNRTGSARDVLLDCCGAATAIIFTYAFALLFRAERLKQLRLP
jgi:VanZ family protein